MQEPSTGRWWGRTPLVARPDPRARERRVALSMLILTAGSVLLVHRMLWEPTPLGLAGWGASLRFTVALLGILGAHELGHWAWARVHGFRLGLPLFLPFPFLFGTLGAVIRIEERPRSRTALLEMAAVGPLLGMAAVAVVLVLGDGDAASAGGYALSRPLLWDVVDLVAGDVPQPSTAEPLAFAAWIGCLVTALNLLPFGQLDGGHVLSAWAPARAGTARRLVTVGLLLGGLVWIGWPLWALVLYAVGTREPLIVEGEPPSMRARLLGVAAAVAFALAFTPVPI